MGTSPPWKHLLLNSLSSNSHLKHAIYLQLATVGLNGRPSNRTVVFRGFADNSDKIKMNTDSRTRKIEELRHCPFAEICWYFTDSWEQYRINGRIDIIDASNPNPDKLRQRERAWFDSSLRSRLQYLGPFPGLPSPNDQSSQEEPTLDPSAGPVDAFCLLVLDPEQVDFLNSGSFEDLPIQSTIMLYKTDMFSGVELHLRAYMSAVLPIYCEKLNELLLLMLLLEFKMLE